MSLSITELGCKKTIYTPFCIETVLNFEKVIKEGVVVVYGDLACLPQMVYGILLCVCTAT
jgi:hypothetical protein